MQTTTPWQATATMPACTSLAADVTADVCVIGAGIAGMTTAHLLAQAVQAGRFSGAPVDLADGYIHFSTADQSQVTSGTK